MWHIGPHMKALKSDLAKAVLADPAATAKLRSYLASKRSAVTSSAAAASVATAAAGDDGVVIELASGGGRTLRLKPVIVPKAA